MQPDQSPYPCAWPGVELVGLGFDALRSRQGTYGLYAFEHLPDLPSALTGDFSWLADRPDAPEWAIESGDSGSTQSALARLTEGMSDLPTSFLTFLASPTLQKKIRSVTACYISLSPVASPSPLGGGRLIRFLSDQQGCVFWYLYLAESGDHAVVASPDFYGTPEEEAGWSDAPRDAGSIWFCSQSFELFLWRYWIENEIWFAHYSDEEEPGDMPALAEAYLADYRRRAREIFAQDENR